MTTFRVIQRHRCALPVRGNVAPNAEYALLAHSMPRIAGSAQINHSDVLPGIRQHL
jgi:hypothetical protein